ncbi:sterol desaturase [Halostagnicola kamekurae]|uniref:Sterol desaturase n=1 Tax=Halostagnicola kamekurae TaxID=619731 RepID=A0A1I6UII7_9EURY|nr:sterol desaturase [Halostagnicola kamekurae]SFT01286.1 hypothetical protein SAMN04488556_3907 [Halostagnicola kamekurae]
MQRTARDTLVALLVGCAVSIGLYWIGRYPSLALVTGLCWVCGLKLTLHIGNRYPAYATGETWNDKRWTGLSVGLVTLAALIGVSPLLDVSDELRLGLGFLITGAGFVAYATGTLAVLERIDGDSAGASAASERAYSSEGD